MGSWGEDGLVQRPMGQVSGRGHANLVLVTKGKGDRSLVHLPDRSPLPSRASRGRDAGSLWPALQEAFLTPQWPSDVPTTWGRRR